MIGTRKVKTGFTCSARDQSRSHLFPRVRTDDELRLTWAFLVGRVSG
jgi:hypothetical protein